MTRKQRSWRGVALGYVPDEEKPARRIVNFSGFSAELVMLAQTSPYDFSWCGEVHYLALHDIDLSDGETMIDFKQVSRLCDLTHRMTFVPAGCTVSGWSDPKRRSNSFTALYFDPKKMSEEILEHYAVADFAPLVYFENLALRVTLEKLAAALTRVPSGNHLYAETLGLLSVVELLQIQKIEPKPTAVKGGLSIQQETLVRDYVEDYLHTNITLADLAALVGLTRFHFARAFKTSVGVSAHQYVLRRRVEYARELLQTTKLDVETIAKKVGFGNSTLLARHFRRLVGMPPSQLRRNT